MPKAQWPTLDGYTLTPLMAVDGDVVDASVDPRPDFVVSQFHGDNIAMSWYLVVKEGVAVGVGVTSTFKLILWGTGKEVPSLL